MLAGPGNLRARVGRPESRSSLVEQAESQANSDGKPVPVGTLTSVSKKVALAYLKKRAAKDGELLQTPSGLRVRVSQVSQYEEVAEG